MNYSKNVIVGMSGGVDSSISAVLLKEMGYQVTGIFMKNWEEDDTKNNCGVADDYNDAKRVAEKLGIKLLTVNFSDKYWDLVFQRFIDGLNTGITPNPDIYCNKEIKFNYFYRHIKSLGYDKFATGHYAKIQNLNNKFTLNIPRDLSKDQTYFLYMLKQDILQDIIFPLEDITKNDVKRIARDFDLEIFEKKESMGICFIGKKNFTSFISNYIKDKPGNIINEKGVILGNHLGIFNYTLGQRKGLGIGGRNDSKNEAWFVLEKNMATNELIVTQDEHKLNFIGHVKLSSVSWVNDEPNESEDYTARFRHGGRHIPINIYTNDKITYIKMGSAERAITPGQSAVIYKGQECIGGGIIEELCRQKN